MKKILTLLLIIIALSGSLVAYASPVDLSSLSFADLIALHSEVFAAIIQHDDFKEVKVPAGEYRVGTDIPAGEYKLTTDAVMAMVIVNDYESMYTLTNSEGVGRFVVKDGDTLSVSGSVIFAPYVGLGF